MEELEALQSEHQAVRARAETTARDLDEARHRLRELEAWLAHERPDFDSKRARTAAAFRDGRDGRDGSL
jgi:predicted  nucleic acid-binding Zn-ribbon protein